VGTGIETNVNELFHKLNSIIKSNKEEKHGPPAPGVQMRSVISSEKLYKKFKWKPSMPLDEGLKMTVEFCRNKADRSEEHTSELQSRENFVCRLLLEKTKW